MSRLLVTNKSFELLEPYEGKLSRTVLRGESSRKGADLLDIFWNCAAIASPCRWQKSVPRSTKRPWSSKSGAKCSVTPIWWNSDGSL